MGTLLDIARKAVEEAPGSSSATENNPNGKVSAPNREGLRAAPDSATECARCAHLHQLAEIHEGTRRTFWWRCSKGHALMEGRSYGERVLLAPPECDAAQHFRQWEPGVR
jgi:hypothetical protein